MNASSNSNDQLKETPEQSAQWDEAFASSQDVLSDLAREGQNMAKAQPKSNSKSDAAKGE
jgi:hypothetical protein